MNKQVTVTFEFDVETTTVSKLKCFVDGIENKKPTTKKAPKKEEILEKDAIITLETGKLVFNNKAIADMGLVPQNRIVIIYEQDKKKKKIPIIGTDLAFDQEGSGNLLSKTNTVQYRGNANIILSEYGKIFTIEKHGEGIWKLVSLDKQEIIEEVFDTIDTDNITVFTEGEEEFEIGEMSFKL
jgi:hypothetical protein